MFKNGTILTTITIPPPYLIKKKPTTNTIVAKKKFYFIFLPVIYKGEGILDLVGLGRSFLGQIGVEFNSQSIGAHYICSGRIRAAPLSALVTKLAFSARRN